MAQIQFFKGDHSKFFDAENGWKTGFEDAICFDVTNEEIWVNGTSFGASTAIKNFVNEGKVVTGVSQDGFKVTFTFANGENPIEVDFSSVASTTSNGLMSSDDKKNLNKLSELLDSTDDSGFKLATSSANGLMSAAHVSLLEMLSGTGGEGEDDPSIIGKVAKLEGDVTNIKGDITAIKEDIGSWESTTETIASSIGSLSDDIENTETGLKKRVSDLEGQITGLSGAMHFKGIVENNPESEGFDVKDYVDGDVVIYNSKEFVFNGTAFVEFGDVSAEGERLTALEEAVAGLQSDDSDSKAIEALTERVAANETGVGQNKTALEQLTARVKANEDKFANYAEKTALEALTERVAANETGIASLNAQLGTGFSEENTVADKIASLEEADKAFATKTDLASALTWQ